ncbi:UDP-N-acetylmuramate dehydrogenase [Alteromonas sp. a30]|uniref:UDP-N-acetylmuramate dehydrogenase n=1 Tax=Alteromonas sp. a30 TaxID=2730917 RepID=UPI0022812B28|nr:UDP-N-acetylmuramate dehydrogenase [Alteromonas sp. a30]MCY7294776.1 UDP-N-acetylmuramate dehydrogenase [Alteromonas sp. a30]
MVSLQDLHSFGLSAKAGVVKRLSKMESLPSVGMNDEPFLVLGEGTNTVFVDDYEGVVVKPELRGIAIKEEKERYLVEVGAGENWHQLVNYLLARNINGLENLAYIPGTVGAAPVQNIGAYGAEFSFFCEAVRCYDLELNKMVSLSREECGFGYRESLFKSSEIKRFIITSVTLSFVKNWCPNLNYAGLDELPENTSAMDVFNQVIAIRRSKLPDPKIQGNAGSFFKNPIITKSAYDILRADNAIPQFPVDAEHVKVPAAWLIEQCGFKGKTWGGVQCHPAQPLVLVNSGQATGKELLEAAREIRKKVYDTFSVHLTNEVRLIGREGEVAL